MRKVDIFVVNLQKKIFLAVSLVSRINREQVGWEDIVGLFTDGGKIYFWEAHRFDLRSKNVP